MENEKIMVISFKDGYGISTYVKDKEFDNIDLHDDISDDDFEDAIRTVYTFMKNKELKNVAVRLEQTNKSLRPNRAMTLNEICDELNANVTIIKDNKEGCKKVSDEFPDLFK